MNKTQQTQLRERLRQQGFDASYLTRDGAERAVRVRCSACEAHVIQGVACHETGCPHQVYECRGCNAAVPRRGAYCEDCA